MPLVSVIMPCYNTEETYFKNAVSSILAQTMTDFELIIIDDASLPYIQEIANSFFHKINKRRQPEISAFQ